MPLTTVVVTGDFYYQDGSPIEGATISFKLSNPVSDVNDPGVLPPSVYTVLTDSSGQFSKGLWPNSRGSSASYYNIEITYTSQQTGKQVKDKLGKINVPENDAPHTLAELIAAGVPEPTAVYFGFLTEDQYNAAIQAASNAEASEVAAALSEANAATSETNAAASETIASAAASTATVAQNQAEIAALAAGAPLVTSLTSPVPVNGTIEILQTGPGAQVYEVQSGVWSFVGWLKYPDFEDLPTFLAYTGSLPEGTVVVTRKEGCRYQIAPAGTPIVNGRPLTTAGGDKLYDLQGRNAIAAQRAAKMPNGSVVNLGGIPHTVDDTAEGALSATEDLEVDGLRVSAPTISPTDFGWTPDVSDSLFYMLKCIKDGRPVDWGSNTYVFSEPIVETISHPLAWESDGAVFEYAGSLGADCVVLNVGTQAHSIRGGLTIDADQKCHSGLRVTNAPGSLEAGNKPVFHGADITVKNVRRHTLALSWGVGFIVYGAFRKVTLTRPSVIGCSLAEAARQPSVFGMQSLVISRSTDGDVEYAKITDPYIEDNFMDEDTDAADQDGIVMFTHFVPSEVSGLQKKSNAIVEGGTVKNVRGRAVKVQGHNAQVKDLTVIKDSTVVGFSGVQLNQREVEFQSGGGLVRDLTVYLDGTCSQDVVGVLGNTQVGLYVPAPIVSGVRGQIVGVTPRSIIVHNDPTQGKRTGAAISDIMVDGPCESIVFYNAIGTGHATVVGANWIGTPTTQAFFSLGVNNDTTALLANIVNSGDSVVPLFTSGSSGSHQTIKATNCINWSGGTKPSTTRSVWIEDGDTASVSYSGFGGYAIIGVESISSFQTILQIATNGGGAMVRVVDQSASTWEVANSTDPGSGSLRAWVSGGALQIKNASGFDLRFNVMIVG